MPLPSVVPAGVVPPVVVSVPVGSAPVVPFPSEGARPPPVIGVVGSGALPPGVGAATEVARGETVPTDRRVAATTTRPGDLGATAARVVNAASSATFAIVTPRAGAAATDASPLLPEASTNAILSTNPGSGTVSPEALNSGIGRTRAANSPASARRPSGRSTSTRDTRAVARLVTTHARWAERDECASPNGVAHLRGSLLAPTETDRLSG